MELTIDDWCLATDKRGEIIGKIQLQQPLAPAPPGDV